ncbi:nucleoside hydrolase [Halolamina sediminis]|jgi:purine nucleosidase|uniref:nucleoside hydrolase n=1 Tax=Halolamina sediminis TaxID=1480675 RepID=UPI0006B40539|nr:nucleoside hydrolase [Halolamina sediminis]
MSRKVLLDVDPGCDDAVALGLALASDELDVVGVTTVAGNTSVDNATRNALSVLTLFDRTDVPVAAGCGRPLAHELETAEEIHGEGGITGELPGPAAEPVSTDAPAFIREQATEHDDLTLVGLGPLTNVAVALMSDPDLPERLEEVTVMGGTIRATGNRTPMAEANFYSDPAAARRVVWDANPKVAGLNVTHRAQVPPGVVDGDSATAETIRAWLDYYPDWVRESVGLEHAAQHDALVVAGLFADVLTHESAPTDVFVDDGDARGAVMFDEYGLTDAERTARVAVDVDVDRFRALLGERLSRLV